jgi:twitching motility protein PilT
MPRIGALLDQACSRGASDVHLGSARPPFARVGGELVALGDAAPSTKELEDMLGELLDPTLRARLAAEHAVTFGGSHPCDGGTARYRGQIVQTHAGLAASLRLFPPRLRTLADLGAPDAVGRLAEVRGGLVVVAGTSGSGKTTTLAAMVDRIDRTRACHVVTIEDPIEVVFEPKQAQITQREVGKHVPSFAVALRNVARERADVVVLSLLREPEAIAAALALARAGVTVLAAVPASSAATATQQLASAVEDGGRLSGVLAGVVVQRRVHDELTWDVEVPG